MSAIPPEAMAKLAKLAELTASGHDGEALSAIRHANALLRKHGATWTDVLQSQWVPERPAPPRAAAPPSSPHELVAWCIERGGFLSKFERNYLHSLVQYSWCRRLTRKEQAVVDDIVRKIHIQMRGEVAA